jgi:ubiquitin-conjugating enzyme E2 D
MVSKAAKNRLMKELKAVQDEEDANITAKIIDDDITKWSATIIGPIDTPYEGGVFNLDIEFPGRYPFSPPKIIFITKVYHPNINANGHICLDILKSDKWTPAQTVRTLLVSILSLFADPNPDDPLVGSIARLYKEDRGAFNKKVREFVKEQNDLLTANK